MKPLVHFYKNQKIIYCDEYIVLSNENSIFDFLHEIEKKYFNDLKVVQIDFDLKKCHVYILKHYKFITSNDLVTDLAIDLNNDFAIQNLNFISNISKTDFINKIHKIKTEISAGRYYQINFTNYFKSQNFVKSDGFDIFKYFLSHFSGNYFSYLPLQDQEILCYSPELFLSKENNVLLTSPIKGTISNSEMTSSDLLKSEKESAELSMIVDLLRNDLNSVCTKPVIVTKHREILNLNYTSHTYSEVAGETNLSFSEILKKILPGGSISGCPKIESLTAIAEYENFNRGFYTGNIGWWKENDFELNIAIRSFKKQNEQLYYYAGCGIVFDSNPEQEWQEYLTKAGKLKIINC